MNITVYSKSNCLNCTAAKQLLKAKGLAYDEYWVDANTVAEQRIRDAGRMVRGDPYWEGKVTAERVTVITKGIHE